MIRTLLADDSASFRAVLTAVLGEAGGFQVVGTASSGEDAVRLARELRPSLVVMDVVMPGGDGIEATARIMNDSPCPVVVMSSLMDAQAQQVVFRALAAGAVDAVGKPKDLGQASARSQLVSALRAMAAVKVVRRRTPSADRAPAARRSGRMHQLVIGASTGGPPALCEVLRHLPRSFPAPIFIAQHLAAGFSTGLGRWLGDASGLPVRIVQGAEPARPATVYLPLDGHHLLVVGDKVDSVAARPDELPVPSVNRLFDSTLTCAQTTAAVLLTGMGADGAEALSRLRAAGAYTIVQDESSSLVYGMPRVAREMNAAREELSLNEIGPRLVQLALGGLE